MTAKVYTVEFAPHLLSVAGDLQPTIREWPVLSVNDDNVVVNQSPTGGKVKRKVIALEDTYHSVEEAKAAALKEWDHAIAEQLDRVREMVEMRQKGKVVFGGGEV